MARDAYASGDEPGGFEQLNKAVPAQPSAWELPTELKQWLLGFERKQGRKLRVLHVGNIANNAYLNAKFLNKAGVQCDVICSDYYHIMGCPEWEDVDFDIGSTNQFRPNWSQVTLNGYERPQWFAQGPARQCIDYFLARNREQISLSQTLWLELGLVNHTKSPQSAKAWEIYKLEAERWLWAASHPEKIERRLKTISDRVLGPGRRFRPLKQSIAILIRPGVWAFCKVARRLLRVIYSHEWPSQDHGRSNQNMETLIGKNLLTRFKEAFPDRRDQLSLDDVQPYQMLAAQWRALFSCYDVVQAYAVDPIYPLITGAQPYVCFEHGTLRDFTMGDNPLHRLTALAYRESDHVFITNGDCLEFAERLNIPNYSAMIHPVDVEQHERVDEAAIAALRAEYGADVLLFCPIRHDWSIKGTDIHIRALSLICERLKGRVVLVMANWGKQLKESNRLAETLGCNSNIVWMPPLSRQRMIRLIQASDVVLDQMALPHFGGTAPQALAAGTPVVMSYRPESTSWIVDEPAPILPAFSAAEVAAAVEQALDPEWRSSFKKQARDWTHKYHSPTRVVRDHLSIYRKLIEARPADCSQAPDPARGQ